MTNKREPIKRSCPTENYDIWGTKNRSSDDGICNFFHQPPIIKSYHFEWKINLGFKACIFNVLFNRIVLINFRKTIAIFSQGFTQYHHLNISCQHVRVVVFCMWSGKKKTVLQCLRTTVYLMDISVYTSLNISEYLCILLGHLGKYVAHSA